MPTPLIRCRLWVVGTPADQAAQGTIFIASEALRSLDLEVHPSAPAAGRAFVRIGYKDPDVAAHGIVPENPAAWTADAAGQYITAIWLDQLTNAIGRFG